MDRITCEKFVEKIRSCEEPAVKSVLKQLCRLWALSAIEKNLGWYMSHSYFAPNKARAVQAEINKLCSGTDCQHSPLMCMRVTKGIVQNFGRTRYRSWTALASQIMWCALP